MSINQQNTPIYWGIKLQRILLLGFILFTSITSFSQDSLNFKTVDQQSYQLYIDKDWDKLIEIGKEALKQDIDYYFLRMRIGIAYFEKKNFRKAIKHFRHAASASQDDAIVVEYLYYSYLNIGDDIQALTVLKKSNTKFANLLLDKQKIFKNVFAFYSTRIHQIDELQKYTANAYNKDRRKQGTPIYAEQYIPESYTNFQLGTTIRLSPSWRSTFSYQQFSIDKIQNIIDPMDEKAEQISLSQSQWNFSNTFRLSNTMKADFFLSYLSQNYEFISINTSNLLPGYARESDLVASHLLVGIGLSREQSHYGLSWNANVMSTQDKPVLQTGLSLRIFPFGNNKLSSISGLSAVKQELSSVNFVFHQEISYSPHERVNLSMAGNWGALNNWSVDNGYSVYNDFYTLSGIYQAKLTTRVYKKLYIKLLYEFIQRESEIWSKSLNPVDLYDNPKVISKNRFNTHSIIGGLIWEF